METVLDVVQLAAMLMVLAVCGGVLCGVTPATAAAWWGRRRQWLEREAVRWLVGVPVTASTRSAGHVVALLALVTVLALGRCVGRLCIRVGALAAAPPDGEDPDEDDPDDDDGETRGANVVPLRRKVA